MASERLKEAAKLLQIGWSLVIGHWVLVTGHWSLITGQWILLKGGSWSRTYHGVVHLSPCEDGERLPLSPDPIFN